MLTGAQSCGTSESGQYNLGLAVVDEQPQQSGTVNMSACERSHPCIAGRGEPGGAGAQALRRRQGRRAQGGRAAAGGAAAAARIGQRRRGGRAAVRCGCGGYPACCCRPHGRALCSMPEVCDLVVLLLSSWTMKYPSTTLCRVSSNPSARAMSWLSGA